MGSRRFEPIRNLNNKTAIMITINRYMRIRVCAHMSIRMCAYTCVHAEINYMYITPRHIAIHRITMERCGLRSLGFGAGFYGQSTRWDRRGPGSDSTQLIIIINYHQTPVEQD